MSEFTFESFKNYVSKYVVGEDDIIKLIYVGINAARRSKTLPAFLLRGPPGAGKTMITQIVADYFNAHYVFIQTTLNTTEDELIYKFVPSEQTRSGVRVQYGSLPDALIKSREKITVLTIDEFDKTRPSADALLLDYLQNARVSFRIDEKEDVIVGDKNNLIVFITSNDNREFSEPLLRRVITINFKLPDPKDVEKLLRRHFDDEKIIKTLTTMYIASLTTELTKPITIQELIQLGHAMTIMPDVDFNQLLLSFVVKNVEDLYKLHRSVKELNVTQITQQYRELPDVGDTIVGTVNNIAVLSQQTSQQQPTAQRTTTVQQLLTRIKLPVNKIVQTITNADKVKDEIESSFNAAIDTNTFSQYSNIIKTFSPEPTDRPDVLGKFKVVLDDTLRLTSDKPLTLREVYNIFHKMDFEAYVEDYVYLHNGYKDVIDLTGRYQELQFTYYTKDVIVAVHKENHTYFVLRLDNVKGRLYKVKAYVNKQDLDNEKRRHQYEFIEGLFNNYQLQNVLEKTLSDVQWSRDEILKGKYFESDKYKTLSNFVNDTKGILDLHTEIDVETDYAYAATASITRRRGKDECEPMYNISADSGRNYVKFTFNYLCVTMYVDENAKVEGKKISIANEVYNIASKYVGEYELLDGIKMFHKMAEELNDYAKNVCSKLNEMVKNGH